ncbi:N-acetylneuraminate 9-O-acetyltransferase [Coccinella septempunctata]|uniref:N-acetylneuraminate 9-O-acetyltransferase n=1 Tax=Coccinella septempunctata TaxID=41139 RepID=UPI001D092594|nr:N-acetylneuraminate 9-O-acetyltransferase [Coccinella septempunctata]
MVTKSRIELIIDSINSKNAKRVAFFLVLIFAAYHAILHLRYGSNSCKWLLSDGRYKGDQEWQPYGCMLHLYTKIDTRRCLRYLAFYEKKSYFAFVGDSRMQEVYEAFVQHIQVSDGSNTETPEAFHKSFIHTEDKLKLKVEFFRYPDVSVDMVKLFRSWQKDKNAPSVIVSGTALPAIKRSNGSLNMLNEYSANITKLYEPINELRKKNIKVLWALQVPVDEEKLRHDERMITNSLIDQYNEAAIEVLTHSSVDLWWSTKLVGEGMLSESPDGIHLSKKPLRHNVQILLNMYCNDYMNFDDGTCCSSTESYTTVQKITFLFLGICFLITIILHFLKTFMKWRRKFTHEYTLLTEEPQTTEAVSNVETCYTLFSSIARISIIMVYFFICDRTNFFMKENKYYSEFSFWLPIGYITVLGLFFTENSRFTKVLHQDQLNETKGWMLLVILVYHVTGANRILTINMHMKVLISSYLFLLGYEQFCYVWHRNDVSIRSYFRMMFQLNFMTVTLCLCMNRPYQFYYFVPLLSFWYMMIYCFLAFPPKITMATSENNPIQYSYLLVKFIGIFSVITILYLSEVFFEKVFVTRPWKALFVSTDDDIREWWLMWKLDRYSVIHGMGFAVLMLLAQKYNLFDDNNHSNLFSRGLTLSATLLAIVGLGCYLTMTFLCQDEMDCSEIHSYVVFIPIISYIILRNISGFLRTRYSSLFAWFGEISLELFVSQYHILLAADNHGVLVLLPGYPVMNIIITSFIFVTASHEFHRLTKVLLPFAVPSDWKLVIRNAILFLAILVPIGINDGMF